MYIFQPIYVCILIRNYDRKNSVIGKKYRFKKIYEAILRRFLSYSLYSYRVIDHNSFYFWNVPDLWYEIALKRIY